MIGSELKLRLTNGTEHFERDETQLFYANCARYSSAAYPLTQVIFLRSCNFRVLIHEISQSLEAGRRFTMNFT